MVGGQVKAGKMEAIFERDCLWLLQIIGVRRKIPGGLPCPYRSPRPLLVYAPAPSRHTVGNGRALDAQAFRLKGVSIVDELWNVVVVL